jgi:hypothetical protein
MKTAAAATVSEIKYCISPVILYSAMALNQTENDSNRGTNLGRYFNGEEKDAKNGRRELANKTKMALDIECPGRWITPILNS